MRANAAPPFAGYPQSNLTNISFIAVGGGGDSQATDSEAGLEDTLDITMVATMAPAAKIREYEAPDATECYSQILTDIIGGAQISVISSSYGLIDESEAPLSDIQSQSQTFAQLAALGVTILESSGDGGSNAQRERPKREPIFALGFANN